jgi:hypothetical protein
VKLEEYIRGLHPAELAQAEAEGYAANKQPPPPLKRTVPPEVLASRKDPSRIWWDKFERSANGGGRSRG